MKSQYECKGAVFSDRIFTSAGVLIEILQTSEGTIDVGAWDGRKSVSVRGTIELFICYYCILLVFLLVLLGGNQSRYV